MLEADTVPSPVSSELIPIITSEVGSESNTMVKVAVEPSSAVLLLIGETVIPASSSSSFITITSFGFIPE